MGQLFSLIPNIENGLFSRFIFFKLLPDKKFHDVFEKGDIDFEEYFDNYATVFDLLQQELESKEIASIKFNFQKPQEKIFHEYFISLKKDLIEHVDEAFGGIVNRLGVICCRITMVLSFYRVSKPGVIPEKIICQDEDFENALQIIEILIAQNLQVYYSMLDNIEKNKNPSEDIKNLSEMQKDKLKMEAKILREKGMSFRQIGLKLFNDKNKRTLIQRWLESQQ